MKFLFNQSKFNEMADYLFRPLLILSIILFAIGLLFSFYLSPDDYQQGSTVRIMYVHVPSAWLALLTYAIMTLYSILALAFRMPFGFIFNTAVAPIGAVFHFNMHNKWIFMGKTNVGYMVGMGCSFNFCSNSFYYLSNYYFYEFIF